jgi:hypothetical protein
LADGNFDRSSGAKALGFESLNIAAEQAAEKVLYSVILSGAKNLSFFSFPAVKSKRDSSLRSE